MTAITETGKLYEFERYNYQGDVVVWREDGHGLLTLPRSRTLVTEDA